VVGEQNYLERWSNQLQLSGEIKSCRWELLPSIVLDDAGTPTAGFKLVNAEENKPNGIIELQSRFFWPGAPSDYPYPSIGNTGVFQPLEDLASAWYRVGMYVFPGATIVSVSEEFWADVILPIDIPAAPSPSISLNPVCTFEVDCQTQFESLINNNPDTYLSLAICQAQSELPCVQTTWTCPTDPTDVRTIWISQGN
jgi:hypothetical protein